MAVHTLGVHAGNLPSPFASFVGRERQIEEVARLVEANRLVTLAGAPGVGKTRLAVHLASQLAERYRDGVWLIELARLDDATLPASETARALGVREDGRTSVDALLQALRNRSLLLILDNCEHVLDACAALAEALLTGCPGVRVLATSRQPLGLTGEVAWRVPALTVPEAPRSPAGPGRDAGIVAPATADAVAVRALLASEAGQLFVERAQAARPTFDLAESNATAIGEICRRVDGLPLAIELAAARISHLTPSQIADRLNQRFRLLGARRTSNVPHHSTLQALIDWSYDLLSDAERTTFRRLAVFVGGWTLEAAEAICDGGTRMEGRGASDASSSSLAPRPSILDQVGALVDKSLVFVDEQPAALRYTMHETVREYARERLDESGDAPDVRRRHVEYYLALAEDAQARLFETDLQPLLEQLEREHDNLRLALRWSIDEPSGDVGPRLAGALWRFWQVRGHLGEGRAWLERLLVTDRPTEPTIARARALNAIGFLTFLQGDYTTSRPLLAESVEIWRALDDRRGLVEVLTNLGVLLRCVGEGAEARRSLEESIAVSRALGERAWEGRGLNKLARLTFYEGDLAAAHALHEEGLAAVRAAGNDWDVAITLGDLADVSHALGDDTSARRLYAESLALWLELGDERGIAQGLEGFAILASAASQWARAVSLLGTAHAIRERITEPNSPNRRVMLERILEAARADLGPAYRSIWVAGTAAAPAQAVADVLAGREPVSEALVNHLARPPGDAMAPRRAARSTPASAASALLSARERQIVTLVASGLTNPSIADALVLSRRTVEWHVGNVLGKLSLRTRAELIVWAHDHGIAPPA